MLDLVWRAKQLSDQPQYKDIRSKRIPCLAQILRIPFLPITWQAPLGLIGKGGQAGINQALINIQISFAFKNFKYLPQDPFREIVQEMVVLSHQLIREHKHIVRLEGICWNIKSSFQVRPVLVFQKTDLGDLHKFAISEKFKHLSIEDKVDLCVDVGIAVRDMHCNGIIHGDIKPANVLVFEEDHRVIAKVADFGFASCLQGENDLLSLPVSEPWDAPEYSDHHFRPRAAKKMDVYSFALLCTWLLFEAGCSGGLSLPPDTNLETGQALSFEPLQSEKNLLQIWKRDSNDKLVKWISWLVREDERLNTRMKHNLTQFFGSALAFDPASRCIDFEHLLALLSVSQVLPNTEDVQIELAPDQEDFEAFSPRKPFATIAYISRFLLQLQISTTRTSDYLALSYSIGFGTRKDDEQATYLLEKYSLQHTEVTNRIQSISDGLIQSFPKDDLFSHLSDQGYASFLDYTQYYRERNLLEKAEITCRREIQTTSLIFGDSHPLNWALKYVLTLLTASQGRWEETQEQQVQLIKSVSERFGEEYPATLSLGGFLLGTYVEQGRWNCAKKLGIQLLRKNEKVWGAEHLRTVACAANLAHVFRHEGEWQNAEEFERQVMEIRMRTLSVRHPETFISMNDLALTYSKQGRWKESEELTLRVINACPSVLEAEHPFIFDSKDNLASIYIKQGRWEEAGEIFADMIRVKEKVLGPEHPHTLISMGNLASAYLSQGLSQQAGNLGLQVVELNTKVLGAAHSQTLISIGNLASAYSSQGLWQEAKELEDQVIENSLETLGTDRLILMSNQALTSKRQGRWEEAERLGKRVMDMMEQKQGIEHPDTLTCIDNLGSVLQCQAKFKEAEVMHRNALHTRTKHDPGLDNPSTLVCMSNLALVLDEQGKYKEAESLHQQTMERRSIVLGPQHPSTLSGIDNLGTLLKNCGQYKEAETLHRQALKEREKALGSEHSDTLSSINNLGVVLNHQGHYEEAESLHERALQTRLKTLGPKHANTLKSMNNLASVYMDNGKLEAAKTAYRKLVKTQQEVLGPEHPSTLNSRNNLGLAITYQGNHEEAAMMHRDTLLIYQSVLGPRHPGTLASYMDRNITSPRN